MGYQEDMDDLKQEEKMREREYQRERAQRTLRTRAQWREVGHMVIVPDEAAVKVINTKAGHVLRLYSEEQTRERTQQELERDTWRG